MFFCCYSFTTFFSWCCFFCGDLFGGGFLWCCFGCFLNFLLDGCMSMGVFFSCARVSTCCMSMGCGCSWLSVCNFSLFGCCFWYCLLLNCLLCLFSLSLCLCLCHLKYNYQCSVKLANNDDYTILDFNWINQIKKNNTFNQFLIKL